MPVNYHTALEMITFGARSSFSEKKADVYRGLDYPSVAKAEVGCNSCSAALD